MSTQEPGSRSLRTDTDRRPLSPYMIGPYYRPQLTSMLSIASRLMGIFMVVVTVPLLLIWLVSLAAGPGAYAATTAFLGSLPGQAMALVSLLCLCYHLCNGVRHLIWDSGRMLRIEQVYASCYVMAGCAMALFLLILWQAAT
jgi:succinate dehydrogenase / fumarate reductase cytochrome b subunit